MTKHYRVSELKTACGRTITPMMRHTSDVQTAQRSVDCKQCIKHVPATEQTAATATFNVGDTVRFLEIPSYGVGIVQSVPTTDANGRQWISVQFTRSDGTRETAQEYGIGALVLDTPATEQADTKECPCCGETFAENTNSLYGATCDRCGVKNHAVCLPMPAEEIEEGYIIGSDQTETPATENQSATQPTDTSDQSDIRATLDRALTIGPKLNLLNTSDYQTYARYLKLARAIFLNPRKAEDYIAPLLAHQRPTARHQTV